MDLIGIPCDRRTLSKDIALLNEQGYEILWRWVGKEKGYYIVDRSFSVPELKILIDAVQSATFVTEKKTSELIDKIAALGGSHRGDILKSNIVHFNTRKHSDESIYYSVDALEDALQQQKKVIFRYFDLDADCNKVYRRDGHHYVVEPVALVFNEDNYYLVVYSARHDNTANYRVDRMDSVEVIDEDICEKALQLRADIGEYGTMIRWVWLSESRELVGICLPVELTAIYDDATSSSKAPSPTVTARATPPAAAISADISKIAQLLCI